MTGLEEDQMSYARSVWLPVVLALLSAAPVAAQTEIAVWVAGEPGQAVVAAGVADHAAALHGR